VWYRYCRLIIAKKEHIIAKIYNHFREEYENSPNDLYILDDIKEKLLKLDELNFFDQKIIELNTDKNTNKYTVNFLGKVCKSLTDLAEAVDPVYDEVMYKKEYKQEKKKQQSLQALEFIAGEVQVYPCNDVNDTIRFGRGTTWCISQPGTGIKAYNQYRLNHQSTFYYVQDGTRTDDLKRVMVDRQANDVVKLTDLGNTTGTVAEFGTDWQAYFDYLKEEKKVDIAQFVNKPLTEEEKKEINTLSERNTDLNWFIKLSSDYKSKYIGMGHLLSDDQLRYILKSSLKDILIREYLNTGTCITESQKNMLFTNNQYKNTYEFRRTNYINEIKAQVTEDYKLKNLALGSNDFDLITELINEGKITKDQIMKVQSPEMFFFLMDQDFDKKRLVESNAEHNFTIDYLSSLPANESKNLLSGVLLSNLAAIRKLYANGMITSNNINWYAVFIWNYGFEFSDIELFSNLYKQSVFQEDIDQKLKQTEVKTQYKAAFYLSNNIKTDKPIDFATILSIGIDEKLKAFYYQYFDTLTPDQKNYILDRVSFGYGNNNFLISLGKKIDSLDEKDLFRVINSADAQAMFALSKQLAKNDLQILINDDKARFSNQLTIQWLLSNNFDVQAKNMDFAALFSSDHEIADFVFEKFENLSSEEQKKLFGSFYVQPKSIKVAKYLFEKGASYFLRFVTFDIIDAIISSMTNLPNEAWDNISGNEKIYNNNEFIMKYIPNLIDKFSFAYHAPLRFFDLIFEKFNNFERNQDWIVRQFCSHNKSCDEQVAEKYIKKYPSLKEVIIKAFVDNYNGKIPSEDFINKYYDEISEFIGYLYLYKNFSEDYIRKFADKIKFNKVLMSTKNLSNEFFVDFEEKIAEIPDREMNDILENTTLPEYFLSKFAHKFNDYNWRQISRKFQLSENFIIKFADKLDFQYIKYNENIPDVVKQNLKVKGYAVDIL
jgi:hypothetical protein